MATAIYVMPLARFLAADFERPPGIADDPYASARKPSSPETAASRVAEIQAHLGRTVGRPCEWEDTGEVVLAEVFDPNLLHTVRSLAAHQEYPDRFLFVKRGFRLYDDPRDHPGLRRIFDGDETAFPHLMRHSDNKGFWLPVDLEEPIATSEPEWWMTGSVRGVLGELARLEPLLAEVDPRVREAWDTLQRLFAAAREHNLPVILDS